MAQPVYHPGPGQDRLCVWVEPDQDYPDRPILFMQRVTDNDPGRAYDFENGETNLVVIITLMRQNNIAQLDTHILDVIHEPAVASTVLFGQGAACIEFNGNPVPIYNNHAAGMTIAADLVNAGNALNRALYNRPTQAL